MAAGSNLPPADPGLIRRHDVSRRQRRTMTAKARGESGKAPAWSLRRRQRRSCRSIAAEARRELAEIVGSCRRGRRPAAAGGAAVAGKGAVQRFPRRRLRPVRFPARLRPPPARNARRAVRRDDRRSGWPRSTPRSRPLPSPTASPKPALMTALRTLKLEAHFLIALADLAGEAETADDACAG